MNSPKDIYFAPLQGFTDAAYRKAHRTVCGGVEAYYASFLRLEHGELRRRDVREVSPPTQGESEGVSLIPQLIASDVEEFRLLTKVLTDKEYRILTLIWVARSPCRRASVVAQVLQKILPFWEYAGAAFDHRFLKRLKKSHNLQEYKTLIEVK